MAVREQLQKNRLFLGLDENERRAFMGKFKKNSFAQGEYVFKEHDSGDTLYIVEKGAVTLRKHITADIDKKIIAARHGFVFGEFSFMDAGERSASALVEEQSHLLSLARPDFDDFIRRYPKAGLKVYSNLLNILIERLRQTNESYRDAIRYSIEITGTDKLNFHYLITEDVNVRIELINGKTIEGKVLQLEKSEAGHELMLVNKMGNLAIIPYHAIITVTVPQ